MRNRTGLHHYSWVLMSLLSFTTVRDAAAIEARVIYRCTTDGVATFSDKPCGSDARAFQPGDSRLMLYTPVESTAGKAETKHAPTPKKKQQQPTDANARSKVAHECRRVSEALRAVRQKMRSGYTVDVGERLKQRKSELERQRRERRCR